MRIERALTIRDAATRRIAEVYSLAEQCGETHDSLLAELRRGVYDQKQFLSLSGPFKEFVRGYDRALSERLWRVFLFAYTAPDGTLYFTSWSKTRGAIAGAKTIEDEWNGEPALRQCSAWPCAHYWPNGKPFTTPKPI